MKKLILLLLFPVSLFGQGKISEMPAATSVTGAELMEIVQGGVNKKITLSQTGNTFYVPLARTLTINGTAYDLNANRSWSVGNVFTSGTYSNPSWITSFAAAKITGTLLATQGGTGAATLTGILQGNGIGSFTATDGSGSAGYFLRRNLADTGYEFAQVDLSGKWDLTTGGTLLGNNTITGSSSNQVTFNFPTLGDNQGVTINSTATGASASSTTQAVLNVTNSGANVNSSVTSYGGRFINTKTGTSSTNIGVYANASGATTNYSILSKGSSRFENSSATTGVVINGGAITNFGGVDVSVTATGGNLTFTSNQTTSLKGSFALSVGNSSTSLSTAQNIINISGGYSQVSTGGTSTIISIPTNITQTTSTTGTHIYRMIGITGTWSETSASGGGSITGIYYNPTPSLTNLSHYAAVFGSGQVGIGTTSPTISTRLDVLGIGTTTDYIARFANSANTERWGFLSNGSLLIGENAGTSGQVLTSAGTGAPPTWSTPSSGITNSAANNELMKSDGTNAVASGLEIPSSSNINLGFAGASSGTTRQIKAEGSGSNINLSVYSKGTGQLGLSSDIGGTMLFAANIGSGAGTINDIFYTQYGYASGSVSAGFGFSEIKKMSYAAAGSGTIEVSKIQYSWDDPALATATGLITIQNKSNGSYVTALSIKGGSTGIGTSPNASAKLDVSSTTKGFLPPRMTGTQAEAISSPAEGLMVYSTDGSGSTITSKGWWGYDGTNWVKLN